ncbi:hypothetical protein [Roseateles violae]|uniref:Uncharacterized protein n=1 Tax=Roseateles violae TaxID=3058042 RepID=A0ABT8DP23_9BURK|nr:hypothetical protein [Pelomonas sp. PFR6]MDN3919897.1 hypothetical protein [Pelomonas sp. PFR6]
MKHSILILSALALASGAALAKLPALSDEAKAKAAETAAKTAWSNKVADFQLCKSMDKVAAAYRDTTKKAGKDVPKPVETPACADPGAFVYAPADAKPPLEQSGAHSPAKTAAAPPSTNAPQSAAPQKK